MIAIMYTIEHMRREEQVSLIPQRQFTYLHNPHDENISYDGKAEALQVGEVVVDLIPVHTRIRYDGRIMAL